MTFILENLPFVQLKWMVKALVNNREFCTSTNQYTGSFGKDYITLEIESTSLYHIYMLGVEAGQLELKNLLGPLIKEADNTISNLLTHSNN